MTLCQGEQKGKLRTIYIYTVQTQNTVKQKDDTELGRTKREIENNLHIYSADTEHCRTGR